MKKLEGFAATPHATEKEPAANTGIRLVRTKIEQSSGVRTGTNAFFCGYVIDPDILRL